MTGIRLEGISKSFNKGAVILSDLNLEVRPGELVTVVGPSGARLKRPRQRAYSVIQKQL